MQPKVIRPNPDRARHAFDRYNARLDAIEREIERDIAHDNRIADQLIEAHRRAILHAVIIVLIFTGLAFGLLSLFGAL